ncbi:MAG: transcription antitermination factor NusB [Bacteroidales bacterium]|nr:transcription antitermination factor NusB [Bacteroidales bacterium]
MINRVLIRIKAVQMMYAYYQSGNKDLVKAEKEFFFSLEKAYELYHYLLQLILAVTQYGQQRIDTARNKYLPSDEERNPNTRFIDNRFAAQLAENKALNHYINNSGMSWVNNDTFVKSVFDQLVTQDFYLEYMQAPEVTYEDDKELWRKVFKRMLLVSEDLCEVLEEQSIYWNDDLEIVITFVMKTIKRFDASKGVDMELLPMYKDDSDRNYASTLFRGAILHGDQYRALIEEATKNWELERLALMDLYILQMALAEILEVEGVPVNVSLNEYIDIAKVYSTQKSGTFVNGILDQVVTTLREQNKLFKA